MAALLRVTSLSKSFDGTPALRDVSFDVEAGRISSIIGPNGAGKTTLLNLIAGQLVPDTGSIVLDGTEIAGNDPSSVAERGLARTFQRLQIFESLSALENVMLGSHRFGRAGLIEGLLHVGRHNSDERRLRDRAHSMLAFAGIAELADRRAGTLTLGQQRALEFARGLAAKPKVLLLDEPASGLNSRETETFSELLIRATATGVTPVVVDHDMDLIMSVSDRVCVLDFGEIIALGSPAEVMTNPRVVSAYLGTLEPAQR